MEVKLKIMRCYHAFTNPLYTESQTCFSWKIPIRSSPNINLRPPGPLNIPWSAMSLLLFSQQNNIIVSVWLLYSSSPQSPPWFWSEHALHLSSCGAHICSQRLEKAAHMKKFQDIQCAILPMHWSVSPGYFQKSGSRLTLLISGESGKPKTLEHLDFSRTIGIGVLQKAREQWGPHPAPATPAENHRQVRHKFQY